MSPDRLLVDQFWAKVDRADDPNCCWLWRAGLDRYGYGSFRFKQARTWRAHRLAYELLVGPVPEGLQLDHLCRVRHCVNPAHLEPVTLQENLRRGRESRTHCSNGHPINEANTYRRNGERVCRACTSERNARHYRKKREARDRSSKNAPSFND